MFFFRKNRSMTPTEWKCTKQHVLNFVKMFISNVNVTILWNENILNQVYV